MIPSCFLRDDALRRRCTPGENAKVLPCVPSCRLVKVGRNRNSKLLANFVLGSEPISGRTRPFAACCSGSRRNEGLETYLIPEGAGRWSKDGLTDSPQIAC